MIIAKYKCGVRLPERRLERPDEATAALKLDCVEVAKHLSSLCGQRWADERFIFGVFHDRKRNVGGQHYVGTFGECQSRLEARQREGFGIFVAVNEFKGNRRKAQNLFRVRSIHADFDGPVRTPPPLAPSLRVRSSNSGTHYYWVIDPRTDITANVAKSLNQILADQYGADNRAKDLSRVLRLAGSWHQKGEPSMVRVVGGTGESYSAREILRAFPRVARQTSIHVSKFLGTSGNLGQFLDPLSFISPDDYQDWVHAGMALQFESGGSEEGLALWDQWSSQSEKYRPGECLAKWRTFKGSGISGGTLIYMAKLHGWSPDRGAC